MCLCGAHSIFFTLNTQLHQRAARTSELPDTVAFSSLHSSNLSGARDKAKLLVKLCLPLVSKVPSFWISSLCISDCSFQESNVARSQGPNLEKLLSSFYLHFLKGFYLLSQLQPPSICTWVLICFWSRTSLGISTGPLTWTFCTGSERSGATSCS